MVRRLTPLCLAALLCPWLTTPARAQDAAVNAPAHISLIEGTAVLERDGRSDMAPASMPLLAGDRVRTEDGRVEVLFDDGSTLHLDRNTTVDFQSDEVIRLLDGRVRLNIVGPARDVSYRIDAPGAWVQINTVGEYRISMVRGDAGPEVELAVLRGAAELANEAGRTPLRAGERAFARANAAPSYAYVFNSAAWDDFDRWSEMRRDQRLALSTQYLPDEVRPYARTFDQYGSWQYQPTYGYVWYPTVSIGWRPYYYGRWASLRPYGWTWIGLDPWAWPTHHYGRWGFSAGLWFWIPGRHWGPAWVSWAYAPGYVSWCPLGWDNRPVIQFVNVNVYGRYRGYDPWRAWTVVPRQHFGTGYVNVNVRSVAGRVDPRGFSVRNVAPEVGGYAVPRSAAPIQVAGTRAGRAMPRGGGPVMPRAAAPGTYAAPSSENEARDRFRSRASAGAPSGGPGFPAAARAPRDPSPVRSGVAVPRDRGVPAQSPPADYSDRVGPPRGSVPSYNQPGGRAVPRAPGSESASPVPNSRAVPRGGGSSTSTYSAPEYRRVPSAPAYSNRAGSPASSSPPVEYVRPGTRAVPRPDTSMGVPIHRGTPVSPEYRPAPPARPPAGYGATPGIERSGPSGPPPSYRSAPGIERSAPSGPPPGYRSAPGGERSAPSGPPPGYRSAPSGGDRRGPSGPAPSAAPPAGSRPHGGGRGK